MGKRIGIKQAAEITGLSVWELRTGFNNGRYPGFRVGQGTGRIIFDADMLNNRIEALMQANVRRDEPAQYGTLRRM